MYITWAQEHFGKRMLVNKVFMTDSFFLNHIWHSDTTVQESTVNMSLTNTPCLYSFIIQIGIFLMFSCYKIHLLIFLQHRVVKQNATSSAAKLLKKQILCE